MFTRAIGFDASDDVGAPFYGFFGVGGGLFAGETLEDYACVFTDFEVVDGVVVAVSS